MTRTGEDGLPWRRSSACADRPAWRSPSAAEHMYLRDGKQPDDVVLRFTRAEWEAFLTGMKAGDFDAL